MGGRQAVRPRTLDPVSKVRILPAQPAFQRQTPCHGFTSGYQDAIRWEVQNIHPCTGVRSFQWNGVNWR